MALDRHNKDNMYLTGRLLAVTEQYASLHYGPLTRSGMFSHPARVINAFGHYINPNDEYYKEICAVPPVAVHTAQDKQRMMLGYYHQLAAYDNKLTNH